MNKCQYKLQRKRASFAISEELIVRVLCPSDMIGRVIGKGGGSIKSVRQASGARIEVDDKADRDECIISITSTESMDDMKSIAVEAVFIAAREDK